MSAKKLRTAALTVERGFFSLAEIRKMKPIVAPKLNKAKERNK